MGDIPEHFEDTFTMSSCSVGDDVETPDEDEEAMPHGKLITQSRAVTKWMNLRYATITLRFEGLQAIPFKPEAVLELVHTATREVLDAEEAKATH